MAAIFREPSTGGKLPVWLREASRSTDDPVAAARALRPLIEKYSDEGARAADIPQEVMRGIAGSGLLGIVLPRAVGGMDLDTDTYIDVIEELSYADASVGWVVMASTFTCGIAGQALGPQAIDAIFRGDDGFLAAGQISTLGRAERVKGGYRVSGNFHFGSGSRYASWLLGAFALEKDGAPVIAADGKPQVVSGFAPREQVQLKGNWDVMGLTATGSFDFELLDQVIGDDFMLDASRPGQPVGRAGVAIGHAAWALGAGRRVLDEIKGLAVGKRRFGRRNLIEQPIFQRDFAVNHAAMAAAGAHVRTVYRELVDTVARGEPDIEVRARARIAACWATEVAAAAGEFAYRASGSDGLRNRGGENVLQRCFRDLYAGTQHAQIDTNILLDASTALLGIAPPNLRL